MNAQPANIAGQNEYLTILDEAWQAHLASRAANAPTVVSLFAGGGGSSLGYSMAGYRELLAVERDDHAVACFKLNFPDVPVFHGDIATLSADNALQMANVVPGELDVLDGSPPCQSFSTAGKRVLDDPRNSLYKEYVRLLQSFQPKAFVMENVSGMVKGKMKLVFAEIMRALKGCGYKVSARLMNAMYFHVPQRRERMIFIGVREEFSSRPDHPKPQRSAWTVRDALDGIYDNLSERVQLQPHHKTFQQMSRVLPGHRDRHHYSHHRLMWAVPAPTIDRGGGAGAYHVWHPSEHRPITVSEIKRLASFPDQFQFHGAINDIFERIGNSVPPLFMRAIAAHVATLLYASPVEN